MKCEACLELLEEYLDHELAEREASAVAEHLITCRACSAESSTLAAEQEMFSHYDRELEVLQRCGDKLPSTQSHRL
jgi:predicted anti-sigma-YlaC factor YlaD